MTAATYPIHDYAKFFPPIEGEEFDALVADVKAHGVIEPIVLYEGKILDGVNRYKAARKAGVEPKFETFRENGHGSALDYVISENIRRRHLTPTQKSVLIVEIADKFRDEGNARKGRHRATENGKRDRREHKYETNPAARRAALLVGVSQATVRRTQYVNDAAKEMNPSTKGPNKPEVRAKARELLLEIRAGTKNAEAADHELRSFRAQIAAKKIEEQEKQKAKWQVENEPRAVAAYIEATATFIAAVESAANPAAYKRFSPEAQRFVRRRHDRIRQQMTKIEENFDA